MSAHFVQLLIASQSATAPNPPTSPNLSSYGASLVQVNWTNANGGTKQTRVYRKFGGAHDSWVLRDTVAAGVATYQTGDSAASNSVYGVSHFDPTTGLESAISTAADLPPEPPADVTQYTYSGTKIGLEWTNTESLPVRCYRNGVLVSTKLAGTTAWDSGYTSGSLAVSHYNSSTGQESELAGPGA